MAATPNPITNLISLVDPNDWAASGGGVVAPGAAGSAFSMLCAFTIYDMSQGSLDFVDNLLANTGWSLSVPREVTASLEENAVIQARFGTGTATETLQTALAPASAFNGSSFLVGISKTVGEVVSLYINGSKQGQLTLPAYAASTAPFGIFAGGDVETAGFSSFAFLQGTLLADDEFNDIFDLWRTQGRLFELFGADLLNLGTPRWAYEAANTVVPVATQDLGTLVNLGSAGTAGNLTTAVDHEVGFKVEQIVNTHAWSGSAASAGGEVISVFTTTGQVGINAANTPLELFEATTFADGDFEITSITSATALRAGRYRITAVADLTQTAGVALEALGLAVEIGGAVIRESFLTVDGTATSAQVTMRTGPFLFNVAEGAVLTVDLNGAAANTYDMNVLNSYLQLERVS